MVLIDSDVFVLDLFYPNDHRAPVNKAFIESAQTNRATPVFNVLEVCGIASFNKSTEDLKKLFFAFHQTYGLQVLYPTVRQASAQVLLKDLVAEVFTYILLKMNFNDALILSTAEAHGVSTLVTWNVKHFAERTRINVTNPEEFLLQ